MPTEKNAHNWEREETNWYVDPPSCAHALFDVEDFQTGRIWDPCCGMGNIPTVAAARGYKAWGSDVESRSEHWEQSPGVFEWFSGVDFLSSPVHPPAPFDIVFNPPYGRHPDGGLRLEERAIVRALSLSAGKVAAVLPVAWLTPRPVFLAENGLFRVYAITPRPSMLPGKNIAAGATPAGGQPDYAWLIFLRGFDGLSTFDHAVRDRTHDKPENWTWRLARSGREHASHTQQEGLDGEATYTAPE